MKPKPPKNPSRVSAESSKSDESSDDLSIDSSLGAIVNRRTMLTSTAVVGATSLFPSPGQAVCQVVDEATANGPAPTQPSLIGGYGAWAAQLAPDPPELSFRLPKWNGDGIDAWRQTARTKAAELIASPAIEDDVSVRVVDRQRFDGLDIEHLSWLLPYGHPTRATLLKPASVSGPLPAVLGLHDHGGNKYFGRRKITRTDKNHHPLMLQHQDEHYGGRAWANELAKRGYVVLVHDTFTFASRRILFEDMSEIPWGPCETEGKSDENPEETANIKSYNQWAAEHEHILAKSLFCAGTTWPGVFLAEDRAALNVLSSRPEVDANRLGCAGLSGGGLRSVYLGGMDPRVRCAICVGFMSTWNDFLLNKSYTHTWMTYAPLIAKYLDFPEILGLRAPLPTMTLSCNQDPLYTLPEMKKADKVLRDIFEKADASDRYSGRFYPGGHKFDRQMQFDAFDWFDKWLQS